MRKIGMILAGLGGFLVMLGLLLRFYAPGQLMVTPLDTDSTTRLSGEATLAAAEGLQTFPVKATSINRVDSEASDDDVVVFLNSTCLVRDEGDPPDCVTTDDPDKRLISASTDNFATDRRTAESINDPKYLPADAEPHEGVVNKWPFKPEKKSYTYWDGTADEGVEATFVEETDIDGLEVYVYEINVEDAPITIAEGVQGLYSDEKQISVDKVTGSIVNQTERQIRVTDTGAPVLDLQLAFTEEEVAKKVKEAKDNGGRIGLVGTTIPVISFVIGIPALILGLLLGVRRRNQREV